MASDIIPHLISCVRWLVGEETPNRYLLHKVVEMRISEADQLLPLEWPGAAVEEAGAAEEEIAEEEDPADVTAKALLLTAEAAAVARFQDRLAREGVQQQSPRLLRAEAAAVARLQAKREAEQRLPPPPPPPARSRSRSRQRSLASLHLPYILQIELDEHAKTLLQLVHEIDNCESAILISKAVSQHSTIRNLSAWLARGCNRFLYNEPLPGR